MRLASRITVSRKARQPKLPRGKGFARRLESNASAELDLSWAPQEVAVVGCRHAAKHRSECGSHRWCGSGGVEVQARRGRTASHGPARRGHSPRGLDEVPGLV